MRFYYSLNDLVAARLERPLRGKDQDIYALLLVGAYQLLHLRIPDHAAINETVAAVRQLKKPWAKGLVNGVLRQIARDRESSSLPERSVELPEWIQAALRADFPDAAERVAAACTERAPMVLRVNVAKIEPADYAKALERAGLTAYPGHLPEQLILEAPVATRDLPGYDDGLVSIQDAGAQFAAHLATEDTDRPLRILDACAAPGGKLFHFAERFPDSRIYGVELAAERLDHLGREAERLGHQNVRVVAGDATGRDWLPDLGEDPEAARFDLVFVDAPCTGSGTLRRHPDIKVLRRPTDVEAAVALQRALLANLWPLVGDGGSLVYCTCSLFAQENDQVIEGFLAELAAADESANGAPLVEAIELSIGTRTRHGWQLLPLPAQTEPPNTTVDGFYFARMTRREKAR